MALFYHRITMYYKVTVQYAVCAGPSSPSIPAKSRSTTPEILEFERAYDSTKTSICARNADSSFRPKGDNSGSNISQGERPEGR